jgi:hypothetical protein
MLGKRILRGLIAASMLLLGSDCVTSATFEAQARECCAPSDCAGHEKPECGVSIAPADSARTVPEMRASLAPPSTAAVFQEASVKSIRVAARSTCPADALQHSPPAALYTFHLALLI